MGETLAMDKLRRVSSVNLAKCLCIVCFSQDDGSGQGGLYKENHPLAAEWPGFGQKKLSGSQLWVRLDAELSSDQERFFSLVN